MISYNSTRTNGHLCKLQTLQSCLAAAIFQFRGHMTILHPHVVWIVHAPPTISLGNSLLGTLHAVKLL